MKMKTTEKLLKWFQKTMEESNKLYIEDIKYEEGRLEKEMADAECQSEDEYLEYLNGQYDDPIEWYVWNFGEEEFGKACLVALEYRTWYDFN